MQERNRRVKIAWGGDREHTVPGTWRIDRDMGGGSVELTRVDVEHTEQVGVPRAWLYDEQPEVEPGHVWFRGRVSETWCPGIMSPEGSLITKNGVELAHDEIGNLEILPAHTIPPDDDGPGNCPSCGSQMYWGTSDTSAKPLGNPNAETQSSVAVPICPHCGTWPGDGRQSANHPTAKPTYARRWDDLRLLEQDEVLAWMQLTREKETRAKNAYERIADLASLTTLRSAEEFTDAEMHELRRVFTDCTDYWFGIKAVAERAIEIAKRSTS